MKYFLFECRSLLCGRFSSAFLISNLSWKRVFLSTFFCTKLKRTFKFSCLLDHRSISLGILACVAGAKRGGRGWGRKARKRGKGREPLPLSPLPPSLFPFSLFPTPFDPPPPPHKTNKCVIIVFDFFWDDLNTQEKLETMVMQNSER